MGCQHLGRHLEQPSVAPPHMAMEVLLLSQLESDEIKPGVFAAKCPGHKDQGESLFISTDPVRIHCRQGCTEYAILAALSIPAHWIFPGRYVEMFWQKQEYLNSHPEALLEHFKELIRCGVKLSSAEKTEFTSLVYKIHGGRQ